MSTTTHDPKSNRVNPEELAKLIESLPEGAEIISRPAPVAGAKRTFSRTASKATEPAAAGGLFFREAKRTKVTEKGDNDADMAIKEDAEAAKAKATLKAKFEEWAAKFAPRMEEDTEGTIRFINPKYPRFCPGWKWMQDDHIAEHERHDIWMEEELNGKAFLLAQVYGSPSPTEDIVDTVVLALGRHERSGRVEGLNRPQVSSYIISLDPEDVEDMGQVGALNRALENTVGMRAHGLVIRERGTGVQHLVDVLREGLEKCKDGRDAILEKWVEDLEKVVMETCRTAHTLKSIPVDYRYPAVKSTSIVMEIVSDDDSAPPSVPKKPKGTIKPKPQAIATRTSPRNTSSRMLEPLFHKSSKAKPNISTPSLSKGAGAAEDTPRANPSKQEEYRAQARFHDPKYIDIDEPDIDRSKGGAKPDQAVLDATVICTLADGSSDKWKVRCLGSARCRKVFAYPRKKVRWLDHIVGCPHLPEQLRNAVKADFAAGAPAARVEAMEKKRKAEEDSESEGNDARKRAKGGNDHIPKDGNGGGQGMVLDLARKSRRTELKAVLDSDVVQFVCASLIPPSVVDLPQWKKMWSDAMPIYTPASSTTLRDSHIPQQAEFVRQKQMEYIKTQHNLTLTLDGVVEDIGPHRIAAMYTDDTGNTRKGRRLTCADYPHIINGKDPVHHMHNGCKDIARLPVFESVIAIIRRTTKFFRKSSGAKGHLREAMYALGISRAKIIDDETIELPEESDRDCFHSDGHAAAWFKAELTQIVKVLEPLAKSIKCLESGHSCEDSWQNESYGSRTQRGCVGP
ncbi:hypothetical protein FRC00_001317 [Tulasnella sp. 408]|nr:hypothetical protein FRC00_001317 [Tulasnella sp. 408]